MESDRRRTATGAERKEFTVFAPSLREEAVRGMAVKMTAPMSEDEPMDRLNDDGTLTILGPPACVVYPPEDSEERRP